MSMTGGRAAAGAGSLGVVAHAAQPRAKLAISCLISLFPLAARLKSPPPEAPPSVRALVRRRLPEALSRRWTRRRNASPARVQAAAVILDAVVQTELTPT